MTFISMRSSSMTSLELRVIPHHVCYLPPRIYRAAVRLISPDDRAIQTEMNLFRPVLVLDLW